MSYGRINVGGGKSYGDYAWKKLNKPKIHINGKTQTGADVTSDNVDLSKVESRFFDGFVRTNNTAKFVWRSDKLIYIIDDIYEYDAVWNPATKKMSLPTLNDSWDNEDFVSSDFMDDTADVVVSNNKFAYPDGDIHTDGYWYKRIVLDNEAVWRKCLKYNVNIVQQTIGEFPTVFKVVGFGVNFSDISYIVGLEFTSDLNHKIKIINENTLTHTIENGTVTELPFIWDSTAQTITFNQQWDYYHTFAAQNMTKVYSYKVSDDPYEYPHNNWHVDGYWYELFVPYSITYSSQDINAGATELTTGELYFVYYDSDITAGATELAEGRLYLVYE